MTVFLNVLLCLSNRSSDDNLESAPPHIWGGSLNHTQLLQLSFWTLEWSQDAFPGFCLGVEKHRANPQAEVTPFSPPWI